MNFTIAQVIVVTDRSGPIVVAQSDGFPLTWEEEALKVVARYGERLPGVRVPSALFAVPFLRGQVAVVQVADVPGSGDPLRFRFLILSRPLYEAIGDPFAISDSFPPNGSVRGSLPILHWEPDPIPPRTIEQVAQVLKDGDCAFLLGATQGLLDGVRVVLKRDAPDDAVIRSIWQLLPTRSRLEVWPATFAFDQSLGFTLVVMPNPPVPLAPGYINEEQAKDYPEGRYELALQTAADHGDQAALDRLLARRSSRDTLKLALILLAIAVVGTVVTKLVF